MYFKGSKDLTVLLNNLQVSTHNQEVVELRQHVRDIASRMGNMEGQLKALRAA